MNNEKKIKMHYLLIDKNPRVISAWREFFGEEENVKILKGDLTDVGCDAIVSPANSFGFMDGGVDYEISMRLDWVLQFELQKKIKNLPERELIVGKAMKATLITTKNHPKIESVAIPVFCTGVGRVNIEMSASQMCKIYKEINKEERMYFKDLREVQMSHWGINPQGKLFE